MDSLKKDEQIARPSQEQSNIGKRARILTDSVSIRAELLLPDDLCSFESVSDLEDPLDQRLLAAGAGEVVGGGIGSGWYRFDLVLIDYDQAVELLSGWAGDLGLPEGSCIRRQGETAVTVLVPQSPLGG